MVSITIKGTKHYLLKLKIQDFTLYETIKIKYIKAET